jgi:LysR family glycine cleavage system transcriptional activator
MKRALPPLLALRAFEAAARSMSFTNAAQELNVTQSAISRQVRTLEDYLQRKLFTRLTRKIELTEEGKAYYQAVGKMFAELEEATAVAAKGRRARTVLTISVLPTVASFWLTPRLS